jgi:hypothetical protein
MIAKKHKNREKIIKLKKKKKKKKRRTVKLHRGGQFFLAEKGNTYIRLHILVGYNIKELVLFQGQKRKLVKFL